MHSFPCSSATISFKRHFVLHIITENDAPVQSFWLVKTAGLKLIAFVSYSKNSGTHRILERIVVNRCLNGAFIFLSNNLVWVWFGWRILHTFYSTWTVLKPIFHCCDKKAVDGWKLKKFKWGVFIEYTTVLVKALSKHDSHRSPES